MTQRLLVMDVDGTVVDRHGKLFESVALVSSAANSRSIAVALASARAPWSLKAIAARIGGVSAVAAFQGAMVVVDGSAGLVGEWGVRRAMRIPRHVVSEITERAAPPIAIWWYTASQWFVRSDDASARAEAAIVDHSWDGVTDSPPLEDVFKVLLVSKTADTAASRVLAGMSDHVRAFSSKRGYCEVISSVVGDDKGLAALRTPAVAETLAVGDGLNDLGLLRAANVSFTFRDAPREVRRAASVVLSSNRDEAFRDLASYLHG